MVTVRVTETYDMKTTVNKLGIIGIHTPTGEQIRRLYPGLVKSHKYIRFKKCDVVGACASVLPADPLQVGVSSGDVAPEDMFNPILYKAVTNSSFDTLVSRIYQSADVSTLGSVNETQLTNNSTATFQIYYSLLGENGTFRKSMPQSGFSIRGLVPICHTLISTYGNVAPIGNTAVLADDGETPVMIPDLTGVKSSNTAISDTAVVSNAIVYRGKSVKMPKLPIHTGLESYDDIPNLNLPKIFVAMLIIPPARLHEFYYRLRVTWTVSFENVVSSLMVGNNTNDVGIGGYSYGTNYTYVSSKESLDSSDSSIDASDVEINKIMES